jgi:hypothetical protein
MCHPPLSTGNGAGELVDRALDPMQSMGTVKAVAGLFEGRHFDREVIILCVRWYLRFKLSLRDLVEVMAERGLSMAQKLRSYFLPTRTRAREKASVGGARPAGTKGAHRCIRMARLAVMASATRCDQSLWWKVLSMLKNLAIVLGLLAGLSACAAPYGYPGYGNPGYGYAEPAYYGYGNGPVYYGPTYPHISEHGTVQP